MALVYIIVIVALLIVGIVCLTNTRKRNVMSFRKSLYASNLPIITFYNNKRELNFILDTGANQSSINERELSSCVYEKTYDTRRNIGVNGDVHMVEYMVNMELQYDKSLFTEKFQVSDMSKTFDMLEEAYEIPIHGILGNTFFVNNRIILDFDRMETYVK